jgi:hypothetical protein
MKNKLGIFTALILSLIIAGSAFAMPKATSMKRAAAKAKVGRLATKKAKKHRRTKKAVKKAVTKKAPTPTKK